MCHYSGRARVARHPGPGAVQEPHHGGPEGPQQGRLADVQHGNAVGPVQGAFCWLVAALSTHCTGTMHVSKRFWCLRWPRWYFLIRRVFRSPGENMTHVSVTCLDLRA